MGITLREIEEDLEALEQLLSEVGGDVSDEEAEQAIDLWLQENQENLKRKLDGYATLIGTLEGTARGRMDEAKRLQGLAGVDSNAAKRLKDRLLWFMSNRNVAKIDTDHYKIAIAQNGGVAPLHVESAATPEMMYGSKYGRFVKVRYEWDNAAIRDALKAGETLPFASLGERGQNLRIR